MKKFALAMGVLSFALLLPSCGKKDYGYLFSDYTFENKKDETVGFELDERLNVDGVLDETVWQERDRKWFEDYSVSNGTVGMKMTTFFAEGGIYFAIDVKDFAIYYNPSRNLMYNTCVQIYLAEKDETTLTENTVELTVTANNKTAVRRGDNAGGYYAYPMNILTATKIDGTLNTSTNEGYGIEMFVPWSVIGLETSPAYVNCAAALVRSESSVSTKREYWTWMMKDAGWSSPLSWLHFNTSGVYELPVGGESLTDAEFEATIVSANWLSYAATDTGYKKYAVTLTGKALVVMVKRSANADYSSLFFDLGELHFYASTGNSGANRQNMRLTKENGEELNKAIAYVPAAAVNSYRKAEVDGDGYYAQCVAIGKEYLEGLTGEEIETLGVAMYEVTNAWDGAKYTELVYDQATGNYRKSGS